MSRSWRFSRRDERTWRGSAAAISASRCWVNEVVINDIEVRPLGVDSIEFDDEGEATISFVPIRPGTFVLRVPGTSSDSQQAVFNVK
jgi:hypothetical protein